MLIQLIVLILLGEYCNVAVGYKINAFSSSKNVLSTYFLEDEADDGIEKEVGVRGVRTKSKVRRRRSQLSSEDRRVFLEEHNRIRREVGNTSSMNILVSDLEPVTFPSWLHTSLT